MGEHTWEPKLPHKQKVCGGMPNYGSIQVAHLCCASEYGVSFFVAGPVLSSESVSAWSVGIGDLGDVASFLCSASCTSSNTSISPRPDTVVE